jgi:hypothetical protein
VTPLQACLWSTILTPGRSRRWGVTDIEVNNVRDSEGGALRAHTYWDNDAFCATAADVASRAHR